MSWRPFGGVSVVSWQCSMMFRVSCSCLSGVCVIIFHVCVPLDELYVYSLIYIYIYLYIYTYIYLVGCSGVPSRYVRNETFLAWLAMSIPPWRQ